MSFTVLYHFSSAVIKKAFIFGIGSDIFVIIHSTKYNPIYKFNFLKQL